MAVVPVQTVKWYIRQQNMLPYVPVRFISSESVSDKELQPADGGTLSKG